MYEQEDTDIVVIDARDDDNSDDDDDNDQYQSRRPMSVNVRGRPRIQEQFAPVSVVGHLDSYNKHEQRKRSPSVEIIVDDDPDRVSSTRRKPNRQQYYDDVRQPHDVESAVRRRSPPNNSRAKSDVRGSHRQQQNIDLDLDGRNSSGLPLRQKSTRYDQLISKKYAELKKLIMEAVHIDSDSTGFSSHARQLIQQHVTTQRHHQAPVSPPPRTAAASTRGPPETRTNSVRRRTRRKKKSMNESTSDADRGSEPATYISENDVKNEEDSVSVSSERNQQKRVTFDESYKTEQELRYQMRVNSHERLTSNRTSNTNADIPAAAVDCQRLQVIKRSSSLDTGHRRDGGARLQSAASERGSDSTTSSRVPDNASSQKQKPPIAFRAKSGSFRSSKSNAVHPSAILQNSSRQRDGYSPGNGDPFNTSWNENNGREVSTNRNTSVRRKQRSQSGHNDSSFQRVDRTETHSPDELSRDRPASRSPPPDSIRVSRSPSGRDTRTDYNIKYSEEDGVQTWLQMKNTFEKKRKKEERRKRKLKRKLEKQKELEKEERRKESDFAVKQWMLQKRKERQLLKTFMTQQKDAEGNTKSSSENRPSRQRNKSRNSQQGKEDRNDSSAVPAFSRLRKYDTFPGASTWTTPGDQRQSQAQRRNAYEDWLRTGQKSSSATSNHRAAVRNRTGTDPPAAAAAAAGSSAARVQNAGGDEDGIENSATISAPHPPPVGSKPDPNVYVSHRKLRPKSSTGKPEKIRTTTTSEAESLPNASRAKTATAARSRQRPEPQGADRHELELAAAEAAAAAVVAASKKFDDEGVANRDAVITAVQNVQLSTDFQFDNINKPSKNDVGGSDTPPADEGSWLSSSAVFDKSMAELSLTSTDRDFSDKTSTNRSVPLKAETRQSRDKTADKIERLGVKDDDDDETNVEYSDDFADDKDVSNVSEEYDQEDSNDDQ